MFEIISQFGFYKIKYLKIVSTQQFVNREFVENLVQFLNTSHYHNNHILNFLTIRNYLQIVIDCLKKTEDKTDIYRYISHELMSVFSVHTTTSGYKIKYSNRISEEVFNKEDVIAITKFLNLYIQHEVIQYFLTDGQFIEFLVHCFREYTKGPEILECTLDKLADSHKQFHIVVVPGGYKLRCGESCKRDKTDKTFLSEKIYDYQKVKIIMDFLNLDFHKNYKEVQKNPAYLDDVDPKDDDEDWGFFVPFAGGNKIISIQHRKLPKF